MNEQIRQLAEQAVKAVDNPFPGNPLNDELAKMYIPDCFAEKFAELIVRECIGIVEQYGTPDAFYIVDEINRVMLNIRPNKHFGVDEVLLK
jgi:hypothetical protein